MLTKFFGILFMVFLYVAGTNANVRTEFPIKITSQMVNSSAWQNVMIVGGTPVAAATDYPFMAGYLETDFQFCGASLISPQWALTAAHCISSQFPRADVISVGSLRTDGRGTPVATYLPVAQTYRHPNYNGNNLDYDVALLRLSVPATIGNTIRPIKLAPANSGDFSGGSATCTGWGLTTEGGSSSAVLREVTYPVITNARCSTMYSGISARMLCAYEPGKDSCNGDSGGPFFVYQGNDPVQVGIVSWGIGCAGVGAPGVYTRVSAVIGWICTTSGVGC